ncbi:MAG: hypothetical protein IAF38_04125, partial [Bacteroidia bacterium]|nr:hypothetical protein [Bacteroidia bacterium]
MKRYTLLYFTFIIGSLIILSCTDRGEIAIDTSDEAEGARQSSIYVSFIINCSESSIVNCSEVGYTDVECDDEQIRINKLNDPHTAPTWTTKIELSDSENNVLKFEIG